MILASLIMVIFAALFFYLLITVKRILRRAFHQEHFQTIVTANCLGFPALRQAFEELNPPVDYARLRMILKCDFPALTFLLKNAANVSQRYSREEQLLIFYFRLLLLSLVARHWLRLPENLLSWSWRRSCNTLPTSWASV